LAQYLDEAGSVSAREAMIDLDMTSATLARRIVDLERAGITIIRERRIHPVSGKRYTRYLMGTTYEPHTCLEEALVALA
jgi:hypothetical protein